MTPKPLTAYYAHPMALYGTAVERADIRTLKALGFKVLNPANRRLETMEDYVKLACSCDLVAFRAFGDGKVGSGMFAEIAAATKAGIPVIELAPDLLGRILTRNETRERMALPPLRKPDTAPLRTIIEDLVGEYADQDWGDA